LVIGTQAYAGTLTDGTASHPLASVNTTDTLSGDGITRVTPDLGATPIPASTVVTGHTSANGTSLTVDSVATAVTSLPTLAAGTEDLVGTGTSGLARAPPSRYRTAFARPAGPFRPNKQAVRFRR
jgi:hypothetical protein